MSLEAPSESRATRVRRFELGNRNINGLRMDMARIDEVVELGTFHCHILEHEDRGMMGQFVVAEPGERAVPTRDGRDHQARR